MSDIEKKWPDHKPEGPAYLHPGVIEEKVKHPDQIKEEKKGWTSYDTDPPHKIDGGLRLTIIFLIIFFLSMIIAGIVKLRKASLFLPDNQKPVVPQAAPYSNSPGSVAVKILSLEEWSSGYSYSLKGYPIHSH